MIKRKIVANASSITVENKPLLVFTNDAFNFQVTRLWSNMVEIIGTAAMGGTNLTNQVTVTINNQPCDRDSAGRFRCWLTLTNLTDSFETNVYVYVCSNNVVASNSGTLFVAKPTETVSNSVAGYPLRDSRFALSWDGWSRLTSIESTNANPNFKVECSYFADGQRASKVVYTNANGTWIGHSTNVYTYDGWNLISETQVSGLTSQVLHYVWSLDVSGQKDGKWGQAAGGIGALISIAVSDGGGVTNTYFPFSDHQGTVHGLRDGSGQIVAQYFYTPYGALIGESGAARDVCPFRFQSQYYDRETGVYQWKRRYYDPVLCRWLSRDPLAEQADPNLFRFCGGDPVGRIDPFGLWDNKGLLESYQQEYGVDQLKTVLAILAGGWKIGHGDYAFSDWEIDHATKTIYINSRIWLGQERSNENAAGQVNEIVRSVFCGEELFRQKAWRYTKGTAKIVGGGVGTFAGGVIIVGSEGLAVVPGAVVYATGISSIGEGLGDWVYRGGGMNILRETFGAAGQMVSGAKGENAAELTYDVGDLLFNLWSIAGAGKTIASLPATERMFVPATGNRWVMYIDKSTGLPTMARSGRYAVKANPEFTLILSGQFIKITVSGVQTAADIEAVAK